MSTGDYGAVGAEGRSSSVYQQQETAHRIEGAVQKFSMILKIASVAELAFTLALMGNVVWFANFTGIVLAAMGFQGARLEKRDYTFTHMVLAVLEFAKNVGMIIFFLGIPDRGTWLDVTIALAFIDNLVLLPVSAFSAFKLWNTLRQEIGAPAVGSV